MEQLGKYCTIRIGDDVINLDGLRPLDINELPWPEDDDISRLSYAFPGEPSSEYVEMQMYASRGCPGACNFCVARQIYYDRPNWRPRKVKDVIKQLDTLNPELEILCYSEDCDQTSPNHGFRILDIVAISEVDGERTRGDDQIPSLKFEKSQFSLTSAKRSVGLPKSYIILFDKIC